MKIIKNLNKKIAENKEVMFSVKVFAGASENSLKEGPGAVLHIKVTAPAEDNKANKALVKFLASQLGLRKYQVEIVKGQTSNLKTIKISR
ncbi:MAG TPA: DUF167 domain-containing protein [Patescibacteria group bacterium]|nr:DUF167 domain-containing protein [Patescibacteria group bacterium]